MSRIPSNVQLVLQDLRGDALGLHYPNFSPADLAFHSPDAKPGCARMGTWSLSGERFRPSIVGQLSNTRSYLGPYGNLVGDTLA